MTEHEKKWIDCATYRQLLAKIRFEPVGSPWMTGDTGAHLFARYKELKAQTPLSEQAAASKELGWKYATTNR